MNRRGFIGMLAAAVAGATLDPDRLLWIPGKKLISIPKDFGSVPELSFDDQWMLTMEEFQRRYIEPAVFRIAREIDQEFYKDMAFLSGNRWSRDDVQPSMNWG